MERILTIRIGDLGKYQRRITLAAMLLGSLIFLGSPIWGNQNIEQEVTTGLGTYLIQITPPTLPEIENIPLFETSSFDFPRHPNWEEQSKSTGFSVFPDAEDLYYEGLELFNRRDLRDSLDLFDELILDHPDSQFYQGGLYWKAQILIRLREYNKAQEVLQAIIASNQHSKYLLQSAHTQIWLALRLKNTTEALEAIERYTNTIFTPVFLEDILPLKAYAHLQLQQHAEALKALLQLQQQFPDNPRYFENSVKIAELYHQLEQWEPVSPLIDTVWETYKNDPQMEHLLYVGISADLLSQNWEGAQKKLNWLEEKGVEGEVFAQCSFYLNLLQNQLERARFDVDRFNYRPLKSKNLRHLFHHAFQHQKYRFLISTNYDETVLSDWGEEGFWVLAHAHEQLGKSEKAYQEYQKAISMTDQSDLQEIISFNLAVIELKLNNFDRAAARLQDMLLDYRQSPRKSEYAFWYGVSQGQLGSGFVPLTMKRVQSSSDRADDSIFYLQRYYHAQNNWEQARQSFLKLEAEYPESPFILWAYYYQADSLYSQQQYTEANEILNKWRNNHQSVKLPEEMIQLWASILIELKEYKKALGILDLADDKSSNFALVQFRIQVLNELDQHESIIPFVTQRLELSWGPEQKAYLYFIRAESAYELQQFKPAIQYYQEALDSNIHGDTHYLYHQLAKLAHTTQNYSEFIKMSKKVLEGPQDQMSNNVLILLSDYYLQLPDKAQEQQHLQLLAQNYENELKEEPLPKTDKAALLFKLAKVKKRLGQYQEADRLFDETIALDDTAVPLEVLEEKGDTALLSKEYKKAAAAFLKVVYLDAQSEPDQKFDLLKKIAYSYEQLGQLNEAKAIFRKIQREFKEDQFQKQAEENLKRLEIVSRETQG